MKKYKKFKVSPSKLEAVRRFHKHENPPEKMSDGIWSYPPWEYMSDDQLREILLGKAPRTEPQELGSAIHEAIGRRPGHHRVGKWNIEVPRCRYSLYGVNGRDTSRAFELREATVEREMDGLLFRGRVDLMVPGMVVDYKTSKRPPAWTDMASSLQWMTYLVILDINHFVYRHYQYRRRVNEISLLDPVDYDLYKGSRDLESEVFWWGRKVLEEAERLDCLHKMVA